ncbi:hypothetical protein LBMAG12_09230 [Actinomycetes bacterium]|nr:hypothetical protein LBMAG12_09230 [Actinomycetes bacterium]
MGADTLMKNYSEFLQLTQWFGICGIKGLNIKKQEIGDEMGVDDVNDVAGVKRGGNYFPESFIGYKL